MGNFPPSLHLLFQTPRVTGTWAEGREKQVHLWVSWGAPVWGAQGPRTAPASSPAQPRPAPRTCAWGRGWPPGCGDTGADHGAHAHMHSHTHPHTLTLTSLARSHSNNTPTHSHSHARSQSHTVTPLSHSHTHALLHLATHSCWRPSEESPTLGPVSSGASDCPVSVGPPGAGEP